MSVRSFHVKADKQKEVSILLNCSSSDMSSLRSLEPSKGYEKHGLLGVSQYYNRAAQSLSFPPPSELMLSLFSYSIFTSDIQLFSIVHSAQVCMLR